MAPPTAFRAAAAREEHAAYRTRGHGHDGAALGAHGWATEAQASVTEAPPSLEAALAQVDAAVAALDAVELRAEPDEAVTTASTALHRHITRLQARLVSVVGEVDTRQAYERDGAVTTKSWFRARTRCEPGEAAALVTASRRLRPLPQLANAFAEGAVTWSHTTAVTRAAIPQRLASIQHLEGALVELAANATPRDVRTAVAYLRDHHDPDGSDAEPLPDAGPNPRRAFGLRETVDGLTEPTGMLDALTAEWLHTLLDAFMPSDPPDTPVTQRRTVAQRRHDALHTMLTQIGAHPDTPHLQGARPHVIAMIDVATLAGVDCQATRVPRLRYTGELTSDLARQIAEDARVTAIQTMGPYRPVSVGRTQRTLPAWLRQIMHVLHHTCCGPDCDQRATWSEAHHLHAWGDEGETDLTTMAPTCPRHHAKITRAGWKLTMDPDTRVATWVLPSGVVRRPHPPPAK